MTLFANITVTQVNKRNMAGCQNRQ